MVAVYNYCGAESAKVTVEPAQDKLDKLPHKPIPVLYQATTEQSPTATISHSLSQTACLYKVLCLHAIEVASFMSSFSADTPPSYWSVV